MTYTVIVDGVLRDATPEEISNIEADKTQAVSRLWNFVREKRAFILQSCDWTQAIDSPLTIEQKANWATYRQSLRDITNQVDPNNIVWPIEPV